MQQQKEKKKWRWKGHTETAKQYNQASKQASKHCFGTKRERLKTNWRRSWEQELSKIWFGMPPNGWHKTAASGVRSSLLIIFKCNCNTFCLFSPVAKIWELIRTGVHSKCPQWTNPGSNKLMFNIIQLYKQRNKKCWQKQTKVQRMTKSWNWQVQTLLRSLKIRMCP